MRIAEFLLARIAEDEAVAANWQRKGAVIEQPADIDPDVYDEHPWVRVLAECESKRRVVAISTWTVGRERGEPIMRALAAAYADHPDFDPAWRIAG